MLIKNNKKMSAQVLLDSVSDSAPLKTFDRNENPKKIIRIKKTSKKQSKAPESVNISNHIEDIIQSTENDIEKGVLSHIGNYIEEPFEIIQSYFKGQYLERLVRHQIESYNNFINYQIYRTIQMFNTVIVHSENDYIAEKDQYLLEIEISFSNFKL